MISAKLIKELEKKGFELDFPGYESNEEIIVETLKENNERLDLAIPLLLTEQFDYSKIIRQLTLTEKKRFSRLLIISDKLFNLEGLTNSGIEEIIKNNKIKQNISKIELNYFHEAFKHAIEQQNEKKEEIIKERIDVRSELNLKKALSTLFSEGKIRIMKKIFAHEKLTNSELKYYYRSIRPLNLSILNENLQKYVRIIESTKKQY